MVVVPFVTHNDSRARKQPLSRLECFLHNTSVNSASQVLFNYNYGIMIHYGPIVLVRYAAKLANKFGVKHTVVMSDQALYDISYGLWELASPDDDTGILLSCVCSFI